MSNTSNAKNFAQVDYELTIGNSVVADDATDGGPDASVESTTDYSDLLTTPDDQGFDLFGGDWSNLHQIVFAQDLVEDPFTAFEPTWAGSSDPAADEGNYDDMVSAILEGGAGNDVHLVNDRHDIVVEDVGGGFDTVITTVSYTLVDEAEVEVLKAAGSDNLKLTGNDFANAIYGNAGNNVLNGGAGHDQLFGGAGSDRLIGGAGADVLTGGSGADTFEFSSLLSSEVDTITDFAVGQDRIALDDEFFYGLNLGKLSAAAFTIGSEATSEDHRIVYDAQTGALSFDQDGVGGAAAVQFASLKAGLDLHASDFFVF